MARLNIAMLADDTQEETLHIAEDHLDVLGQQVEDDMLQLQQQQAHSDNVHVAIEDAIQATEDLMDEQQAAEELLTRKEEATQAAMESIGRNVNNILRSIGMEANQVSTYVSSGEGKKAENKDTEEAAKVTSTTIGEFIKKIWEKIKEVWLRVVDAIKGFFKNLFNASVGLKKRAMAIKSAAKGMKGKSIPSDAKFEAPESVISNMRLGHRAIPAATIDKGLARQNEEMSKYKNLDARADDFKKFSKEIEKIQAQLIGQNKEVSFAVRKMQSMVAAAVVRFFMNIVKTVATQARVIDMQVNKAAIDWCAASLKLYK